MKDEDWVDSIENSVETYKLSVRQRFQALNYMALDDETLERLRNEIRNEWDRRQTKRQEEVVQEQLKETQELKRRSMDMYMDYSETEEENLEEYLRNREKGDNND